MRNHRLGARVQRKLDSPYLVDDDEVWRAVEAAKAVHGARQISKHDNWTARIVKCAVEALRTTCR